jgi:hypothetical protein
VAKNGDGTQARKREDAPTGVQSKNIADCTPVLIYARSRSRRRWLVTSIRDCQGGNIERWVIEPKFRVSLCAGAHPWSDASCPEEMDVAIIVMSTKLDEKSWDQSCRKPEKYTIHD